MRNKIQIVEQECLIDGRRLLDLLREVELPQAKKDGTPSVAGSYGPGLYRDVFETSKELAASGGAKEVVGLLCECGAWGCWNLSFIIQIGDEAVTWRDFSHSHRDWDYRQLGPFVFEREQYLVATAG
ncbi:MAG: hypothetical protein AB7S38_17160 [Vulcanimicrobiota bacterium]